MSKYVFGVDVGGTTVKMGLFTVEGEVLDKWEIKTRTEDGGKNVLPDIADSIKSKLADKNLADEDIEGVGIGVPGPVKEDGTVLKCVNLGWGILNVQDELRALTGFEVKAGNDANVAALGEMWQGGGKGYSNVVMVTLGTGVGGGIILNGKMLFGHSGGEAACVHIQFLEQLGDQALLLCRQSVEQMLRLQCVMLILHSQLLRRLQSLKGLLGILIGIHKLKPPFIPEVEI